MRSGAKEPSVKLLLKIILPVVLYGVFRHGILPLTGPLPNPVFYLLVGLCAVLLCGTLPEQPQPARSVATAVRQIGKGSAFGAAVAVVFVVVFWLWFGHPSRFLAAAAGSGAQLAKNCLYFVFLVAPVEELLFRRYYLFCFEALTRSPKWAVVLQALLFGLWHWAGPHSLLQVLSTAVLGLLYGAFLRWGRQTSLVSVVAAHGAHNLLLELIRYCFC